MMKFAENGVGGSFFDTRLYIGTWEHLIAKLLNSKDSLKMAYLLK